MTETHVPRRRGIASAARSRVQRFPVVAGRLLGASFGAPASNNGTKFKAKSD